MNNVDQLKIIANELRIEAVKSIYKAKSGHIGGSLSAADIIAALYFYKMNVRPEEPKWPDRDRFVLSKGHGGPVLYAALARKGYFDKEELNILRSVHSHLQGAPGTKTPGIDMSAGPLGQGLSAAVGIALGGRYLKKAFMTYCMLGDGEIQEGQVWEAMMSAAAFRLGHLVGILDYNKVQMCGTNEEIMPLGKVCDKFAAFGWNVLRIDGHDMQAIVETMDSINEPLIGAPTMIVADTVKSRGIPFMEGLSSWHGAVPNEEQYLQAMKDLEVVK